MHYEKQTQNHLLERFPEDLLKIHTHWSTVSVVENGVALDTFDKMFLSLYFISLLQKSFS